MFFNFLKNKKYIFPSPNDIKTHFTDLRCGSFHIFRGFGVGWNATPYGHIINGNSFLTFNSLVTSFMLLHPTHLFKCTSSNTSILKHPASYNKNKIQSFGLRQILESGLDWCENNVFKIYQLVQAVTYWFLCCIYTSGKW